MAISFKRRPLSALPFGSSGGVSVVAEVCESEDNRISQLAFPSLFTVGAIRQFLSKSWFTMSSSPAISDFKFTEASNNGM